SNNKGAPATNANVDTLVPGANGHNNNGVTPGGNSFTDKAGASAHPSSAALHATTALHPIMTIFVIALTAIASFC
ncbi:hypothetical protein BGZ94_001373, partial [Podila epigama]